MKGHKRSTYHSVLMKVPDLFPILSVLLLQRSKSENSFFGSKFSFEQMIFGGLTMVNNFFGIVVLMRHSRPIFLRFVRVSHLFTNGIK